MKELSKEVILKWVDAFKKIIEKNGIAPEKIYGVHAFYMSK